MPRRTVPTPLTHLAALLSALLAAGCVSAVRRGELAAEAGDPHGALAAWEAGARSGDPEAQFLVGLCHEEGRGTPIDFGAAAAWYEASARQGFAPAQNNLGLLCFRGRGTPRDADAAARWFARAADQRFAPAQCNRGMLFLLGQGEPHDPAAAREWLGRAAANGDERARRMVAALERAEGPGAGGAAAPFAEHLADKVCSDAETMVPVAAPAR